MKAVKGVILICNKSNSISLIGCVITYTIHTNAVSSLGNRSRQSQTFLYQRVRLPPVCKSVIILDLVS